MAHPFKILPGHQRPVCARVPGPVGQAEGHRAGGHRRLHPPGLAGGAGGQAGAGQGRPIRAEGGIPPARGDSRRRHTPLCGHRGDQHHL